MSTSLIESQRQSHLALENYEQALVQLLVLPDDSHKLHRDRLAAKHRSSYLLDRIVDRSSELRSTYADESGLRKSEVASIASGGVTEFYDRLAKLKEYHRRFPENAARGDDEEKVDYSALTGAGLVDSRDCQLLISALALHLAE